MKCVKKYSEMLLKIFIILAIMCGFVCCSEVHADSTVTIQNIIDEGNSWITEGKNSEGGFTDEYFVNEFVGIGQVLVVVGLITILIVSLVMAIKWITAKPDQQAVLKQQLVGLVVAMVVIFGAIGIWSLVRSIMQNTEAQLLGQTASYEYNIYKA